MVENTNDASGVLPRSPPVGSRWSRFLRSVKGPFWLGLWKCVWWWIRSGKLWETLNKPVMIMVLSTILFGGVTTCIANAQQVLKDRAASQVDLVKIQSELRYRLWRLDQVCATASGPGAGAGADLGVPIRSILDGHVRADPAFEGLHMAAIISRFEMQAGIAHDPRTLAQIRLLEQSPTVSKRQVETALKVLTAYEKNRSKGLNEGDLPLKLRNFRHRKWLKYPIPKGPYQCGQGEEPPPDPVKNKLLGFISWPSR